MPHDHDSRAPLPIEVDPNPATLAVRKSGQFTAIAIFAGILRVDITDFVLWTSSDRSLARIDTIFFPGYATARNPGTVTITADFFGITGTATLTVTP